MLESFIERFTPRTKAAFVERIEQDSKAVELEERKQAAEQKREAQKTLNQESPAFLRAVDNILKEKEAIKKRHAEELLELDKRLEPARADLANLEMRCRPIIDAADQYLTATADRPKIYQFQKELEERRSSMRPEFQEGRSFEGKPVITHSTAESVNAAVDRINQIICRDLKALALEPLNESELKAAIETLRQSIPFIEMKRIS